jgi:hypothetical protein
MPTPSIVGGAVSYKLDDEEASVAVPSGVLDVEEVGTEGDAALGVVEAVSVVAAPVVELSDVGAVDAVEEADAAALFEGRMLDVGLLDVWAVVVDVAVCVGVEVDETIGGAFSIYVPEG